MKVVIASNNQGKINEFKKILVPLGYEVSNMEIALEETGETFEENALLKAEYIYKKTGHLTIADDSGLCIEALPDILGVYSARFMGEDTDYQLKMQKILELLSDKTNRSAYFKSVIALVGDNVRMTFDGICTGIIADEILGSQGFGYDPIFIPDGFDKSFGELDASIKNKISHRSNALIKMVEYFNEKKI